MSTAKEDHANADSNSSNAARGETYLPDGPYDGHWWSGSDWPKYPFAYDRNSDKFRISYNFMQSLYGSDDRVRQDLLFDQLKTLGRGPIGDATVTEVGRPKDALSVTRPGLPRWYPAELGYRATAVWRGILTLAMDQRIQDPVAHYLDKQTSKEPPATAQYPRSVRDLIVSNSRVVHYGSDPKKTWIGGNVIVDTKKAHIQAFPGVQVGLDGRVKTVQGGGSGPFSIEAAFILATQVAGINFRNVAKSIKESKQIEGWWIGVLMPGGSRDIPEPLKEQGEPAKIRLYGKYLRSAGNGQHDVDAGIYIAFDLDPTLDPDDERHNVFVFIVHAIDAYSVIEVDQDSYLQDVNITRFDPPNVVDGKVTTLAEPSEGSSKSAPKKPIPTRQVAHAHAGILKRKDFINWLFDPKRDAKELFPVYTQISMLHLYILTEDWDSASPKWLRKKWLSGLA